ncbi:trypsin-like peptidase domain-containing protein [Aequorivita viscosa]|nr:trypsin-like peptidase domain-containing protein [Aequorivita viscosa]
MMKNLFNTLNFRILFMAMWLMLSGCNGCSRYDLKKTSTKKSRDFSTSKTNEKLIIEETSINNLVNSNTNLTLKELFKNYKSAVFMIITSDGQEFKQGTGFFISSNGIGISNYHVFKGTNKGLESIKLESGEQFKISEVITANEEHDYIIFKVDRENLNYFNISLNKLEIGEEVFAIGNPKGLEHTLSQGIISGYRGENDEFIQTTTEITHGSSGGPLLNMNGEVIGITTSGLGEANLNFAIDIHSTIAVDVIKL